MIYRSKVLSLDKQRDYQNELFVFIWLSALFDLIVP